MMEMKRLLLEEVRTRLYARLKDTASTIAKEIIQREIAERVRKQVNFSILNHCVILISLLFLLCIASRADPAVDAR